MSVSSTPIYGLKKPDDSEFYDIGVHNSNMDVIEEELRSVKENKVERTHNVLERLIVSTQAGLEDVVNNTSSDYPPQTHYTLALYVSFAAEVFRGGEYLFTGYKTDTQYEIQQLVRYDTDGGVRAWARSKYAGTWGTWQETTSRTVNWTPHLYGSNGAEISLSSKKGYAVVNGLTATCEFQIEVGAVNGATGYITMRGFPFVINPGAVFSIGGYMHNIATSAYATYYGAALATNNEIVLRPVAAAGGASNAATIAVSEIKVGTLLQGSFNVITI